MKLSETRFYALGQPLVSLPAKQISGYLLLKGKKYPAELKLAGALSVVEPQFFFLIRATLPGEVRWGDLLPFRPKETRETFELKVIYPEAEGLKKLKDEKLISHLAKFSGSAEDMLLALAEEAGIRGLRQEEILNFCRLGASELRKMAMNLEKEGQIHILEFSPLFLLSQRAFDFLTAKILAYLENYHLQRPQESGLPIKKIKDRFSLPKQILRLSLNRLVKDGKAILSGEMVTLPGFETRLSAEEHEVMKTIENLLRQEKFSSSSFDQLVRKFKIHPSRMNTLLDLLLRQKKIVKSQDGFILHSDWLDYLKGRLSEMKRRGQTEFSVGEFKALTGLTRKYAIPLLEFLDELGLTKRIGNKRQII
ncbi:MAG: SelB C-terminal domain-containing protein [Candidatus Saccharicenans sp.]